MTTKRRKTVKKGANKRHALPQRKKAARQEAFLQAFRDTGNISVAAKLAGVDRKEHYRWLEAGGEYPKLFEDATDTAADGLEAEARRRAVEGIEEPVGWFKGEPGGYVKRYSDTLLIFLLKGAKPEKYRERYEHTGKDGDPLLPTAVTVTIVKPGERRDP